jgi:uncharacterized membrane protein YebE (DUF533 family)
MFDAKSLLEQLVTGAGKPAAQSTQGGGGLADILGQVLQGGGQSGGQGAGGLGDILGKLGQAGQGAGGSAGLEGMLRNIMGGAGGSGSAPTTGSGTGAAGGLGLDDILGKLKDQAGQLGGGGSGNLLETLSKALGQATEGVKEGAGRIGDATGARDALGKAMGGRSPDDILAKLKDLVAQNQLGAGAALGGLGGLLLGTQTGRGVAASAVKLGALALIGGLAYKAYQNYETGKPLITGASTLAEAPRGSGFEPEAVTNDSAVLIIRTMIAAAAADGRIDENEKRQILSALGDAAGNDEAKAFVQREVQSPASPATIASGVRTQAEGLQVYAAARVAIETDSSAERAFLADLASKLGIDAKLAAHIDATAKSQGA